MSRLSEALIQQARELAERDPRRPKLVSLRRAVSAAYYGVFHMLSGDIAWHIVPAHRGLREMYARSFEHGEMKTNCASFAKDQLPPRLRALVPTVSPRLRNVATAFVELQAARHDADYNLQKRFTRSEAIAIVEQAEEAKRDWNALPWNEETDTFAVMLAAGKKMRGD